ncbi:MAG: NTP transferase domain-containing protein [Patescibacteria group bacterium]|nr:NTP transferase domain-containing protein [Patescibacteria group bacterium]
MDYKNFGTIVLAAGKGRRMNSRSVNKVTLPLASKPMIVRAISLLEEVGISQIVVVVGFAKKSVMNTLGNEVIFAEQRKRLGTGHAVLCGFKKLPKTVTDVLVINGDDSAFYTQSLIEDVMRTHFLSNAAVTFLTIEKNNPFGLGRILRNSSGQLVAIIEDKNATQAQKRIKEINPGCYVVKVNFLERYLKKIKKNKVTGEYYLTDIIALGIASNEKIESVKGGRIAWRGVNTQHELKEAEKLFLQVK